MIEPPELHCLRCKRVKLVVLPESSSEIMFFACPQCHRQFAKRPERSLCDRWLSPISLLLYSVIYARKPSEEAGRAAEKLANQVSPRKLRTMIAEAKLELEQPTQQIRDILPFVYEPTEEDLREYLRLVVSKLEERVGD